jgi:Chaperone of endosialidase
MKHKLFCSELFLALFLISFTQPGWPQIPQCLNFQGTLRNTGGALVGGTHNLTFKIYTVATGGSSLWDETINGVRVVQGIFTVILGDPTRSPARPLTIAFDKPYWLGISIDGGAELTQRIPLCASPYALNSRSLFLPFSGTTADASAFSVTTSSTAENAFALRGIISSATPGKLSAAVSGLNNGSGYGVWGTAPTGIGVYAQHTATTGLSPGVYGSTNSTANGSLTAGGAAGVFGLAQNLDSGEYSAGVLGINYGTTARGGGEFPVEPPRAGVLGIAKKGGRGVMGIGEEGSGVYGETSSPSGYAGYFVGRVYASGNVGIGTTVPNPSGEISWSPVLTIGPSSTNKAAIVELQGNNTSTSGGVGALVFRNTAAFASQDDRLGQIQVNPDGAINSGFMSFHTTNVGALSERMRITKDGNIGIGTKTPARILTVVQNSATDPVADAWTTYSSRRWKTNITPIANPLDKVQRLRGVYYDWKANGKHDIGLIAEEVGEVIPEVVQYEANGKDATSVDYARLVALLIEAVKEQQKEIAELKTAVKSLAAVKLQTGGEFASGEE